MNFSVKGDRCLILLDELKKTVTVRGIEMKIPDNHSERSRTGVIKAIGERVTMYFPGQRVVVGTYAGTRLHLIGEEFEGQPIDEDRLRVIREEEVNCLILD